MKFRFLTAGESHGKCLTAIIEGVPAGFSINIENINKSLAKRQEGYGRGARMQIEKDRVIINSGVRHGYTTGAPVTLVIENKDWENWKIPMSVEPVNMDDPKTARLAEEKRITRVRPGHADLAGVIKYGHNDVRDVLERSSARETAIRAAVGAFAKGLLGEFGINIESRCDIDKEAIDRARQEGDTLGGMLEITAGNVPVGLGSYVHWDRRLDGRIAQAIMSIPAIKSVSIGAGEDVARLPGSQIHDEINTDYSRKTNNAGGIEGGMSNGMPIVVKAAMKPIPTLKKPLKSVDIATGQEHIAHYERSDVCALEAAGVVAEAMLAIIITDAFLEKFGGDSLEEIKKNVEKTA